MMRFLSATAYSHSRRRLAGKTRILLLGLLINCPQLYAADTESPASVPVASSDATTSLGTACLFCRDYLSTATHDAHYILTAPLRWRESEWWTVAKGSAVVVATMALVDKPLQDSIQRHRGVRSDRIANTFEPFGQLDSFYVLGGFYLAGHLFDAPTASAVTRDGLVASVIAGGIITPFLKLTFGRSRPKQELGAHHFRPFGGDESFPSGHATQAFTVASVIAHHYDNAPLVDITAYGIAALVGYARVEHNAHFLSDVLVGALIGTTVGGAVVELNTQEHHHIALAPMITPGEQGMELSVVF